MAARAASGKKRQAAVNALRARHDDLLPALVAYVEDPNQSIRKLVHGIFRSIEPRTKAGVAAMCQAITTMIRHIHWSRDNVFATYDRDLPDRRISMSGASENFDAEIHGDRHLLYIIAYDELTQHYACLNLLDHSDNPPVYSIDHDGSNPYLKYRSLSAFLAELRA